jgi:hypothetical protein
MTRSLLHIPARETSITATRSAKDNDRARSGCSAKSPHPVPCERTAGTRMRDSGENRYRCLVRIVEHKRRSSPCRAVCQVQASLLLARRGHPSRVQQTRIDPSLNASTKSNRSCASAATCPLRADSKNTLVGPYPRRYGRKILIWRSESRSITASQVPTSSGKP